MRKSHAVRALAGGAAALGIVIVQASGAFAYDCIQVSRSEKGNMAAGTHSQAWFTLVVADEVATDVEMQGLPSTVTDCILELWEGAGGAPTLSLHVKGANGTGGVIGENNPNADLYDDGHGIDHLEYQFPAIAGIYETCGADFFDGEG